MLSRINNDEARITKEMEISSFIGRYQINAPGPGVQVGFIEDPHIRLQLYGANLYTNMIGIENELTNRTREVAVCKPLTRYVNPAQNNPTIESRIALPAWIFRDKENPRESISVTLPYDVGSGTDSSGQSSRLMFKRINNAVTHF
jgi:hypothetical protein